MLLSQGESELLHLVYNAGQQLYRTGYLDIALQRNIPGMPRKTFQITLNDIRKQVEGLYLLPDII